jgi:peptidyl-tRNA hydrolase, PTH1 family
MAEEKKYNFETIRAIIGLGNPGASYLRTRHSIGFRVVDAMARHYGVSWNETDMMAHTMVEKSLYLIKPLTYMNNSGKVLPFLLKKGIGAEEILVVHDELEKSFGKLSIRWNGGLRGHNGLRSIDSIIGKEFWRMQFGIGRPDGKCEVGGYVLSPFLQEEEKEMEVLLEKSVSLIRGGE